MRSHRAPGEDRRVLRLDRPDLDAGIQGLQHLANAAQRAPRAHTRAEAVDRTRRLLHDLKRRMVTMHRRIRGIRELLRHVDAGILLRHPLRDVRALGDGVADVARVVHHYDARAVVLHELPPLFAHAVGHHDHRLVALHRADEGETNALISAGRLDDDGIRLQQSLALGRLDHVQRRARLDGTTHIERLELDQDFRTVRIHHPIQANQRRVPDGLKYRIADHLLPFLPN